MGEYTSDFMLNFKEIKLEDKEWMNDILRKNHKMSCEYCFGNNYIWKKAYDVKVCRIDDYYTLSLYPSPLNKEPVFLYPVGTGDIKPVIDKLMEHCKELNIHFRMYSLSEDDVNELQRLYPDKFDFTNDRGMADYIYKSEDLINLSGKKYHSKRNHIARFKELNWSFEEITDENFEECLKMNDEWCKINNCGRSESIRQESCAVTRAFKYYKELDFFGGLLRVDGKIVAYTIAERLNSDTVVIHIEKAFSDIRGAYPAINQEFAARMCKDYTYINREEDMGEEGLRKAKLSYYPYMLCSKYGANLKNEY